MQTADIIVIGAGIAGASAAAELAAHGDVTLLEMEAQAGYHATGRSAAFFAAAYGSRLIRDITASCEQFFLEPPEGFTETNLIRLRDCMFFGRADQMEQLLAMQEDNPRLQFLDATAVRERVPVLSADYLHGAMWDRMGGDLDVDAILQAYLRLFRRRGGVLHNNHCVNTLRRTAGVWQVDAGGEEFRAPVVVNAAGAWVERMSERAGLASLGIRPFSRTAFLIDPPEGTDIGDWPLMLDAHEDFYFKPDAGQIMVCPADETPTDPGDAQADDLQVAIGVDRFEKATGLDIRHVNHRWAGLRTFAPDRVFVAGFDPRTEGFFWLAGQGGYGVQSAPAMAHMTSWLVTGEDPPLEFAKVTEFKDAVSPDRLL
jgi:D-arginine dehydrogenase